MVLTGYSSVLTFLALPAEDAKLLRVLIVEAVFVPRSGQRLAVWGTPEYGIPLTVEYSRELSGTHAVTRGLCIER